MAEPWSNDEFTDQLRAVGAAKYHDKHPFHKLMNDGKLDREQLRTWVVNRFYYQKNIPVKDALILAKCPVLEIRRKWILRVIDHDGDGTEGNLGGIEKWLRLGEAMGLDRKEMISEERLLPPVRYSVDAYVNFVRDAPWVYAAGSSLTELFAPKLMATRIEAFEKHYTWIDKNELTYFRGRLKQAPRDSEHGLQIVQEYCKTRAEQERAIATLSFKCDTLWAQLDAIYYHCTAPTKAVLA